MRTNTGILHNWGLYPSRKALVAYPETLEDAAAFIRENDTLIPRGNGRCYGDAALAPVAISTLNWNKILDFDAQNGLLTCQSGVLLADIIEYIVPKGWFFHVTPGTKLITIGGAIAADVHGKNHPKAGCFSQHLLWFDLMREDGSMTRCSKTENSALFWRTCGGLGLTGLITAACFQLRPLKSAFIRQKTRRFPRATFADFFREFETHNHYEQAAGWLDFSTDRLRGALFFGKEEAANDTLLSTYPLRRRDKSFIESANLFAPGFLLNRWSIKAYNAWYYLRNPDGERRIHMDQYYYPLDAMGPWNRLYGRRGMIQFQCCLPLKNAEQGFEAIETCIRSSAERPFLSVLKKHGSRPPEALNAFPIEGYSLALDFPRTTGIPALIQQLDACLDRHEGKVYLVKDACSAPHLGRLDLDLFPSEKFVSDLKRRISHD